MKKTKLFTTLLIVLTFIVGGKSIYAADYIPPVVPNFTHFNKDYYDKMVAEGKPTQESPWGFQEIYIKNAVVHNVSSIDEYKTVLNFNSYGSTWVDGKTHIINFASGEYILPNDDNYFTMQVPSKTIIQGAGMGKTIFKAVYEWSGKEEKKLFNLENSEDIVIRNLSFYNETKDNKWGFIRGTDWHSATRENFLLENIEYDDAFGSLGVGGAADVCNYNFITLRGLRKRIGNTTNRIKANYNIPVPSSYQFPGSNDEHICLAGQIGVRGGNSVVFHDCIIGDNISATIDVYNNYIEMVGIKFIDPLHDHSVKCPRANHLYIHDSDFELTYADKIINSSFYNPTFFTHEGGSGYLANYHFKNLSFTRAGQIRNNGTLLVESEPFTLYDNRPNNVSGDMVWENIEFKGYEHQIVGYPNVQTKKGFKAINYTDFTARAAQLKSNQTASFSVSIEHRTGNSKEDITGVYSWGQKTDGSIDFPRDNRSYSGTKSEMENQPYVKMNRATVKKIYNARLIPTDVPEITNNAINLSVYPNPVEEIMTIKSATSIRSISITNIAGQEVLKAKISSNRIARINTSDLKSGVYFMKVIDVNGEFSTKKIVKK